MELGKNKREDVGHVLVIDTGGQTTISGTGKIFDEFKESGTLKNYTGYGQEPKTFFEKGYKRAGVRYMNFDETYHGMPYDCRCSKNFFFLHPRILNQVTDKNKKINYATYFKE